MAGPRKRTVLLSITYFFIESPKRALIDCNLDKRAEALNMVLGIQKIPQQMRSIAHKPRRWERLLLEVDSNSSLRKDGALLIEDDAKPLSDIAYTL
jgi:hypothetical protein